MNLLPYNMRHYATVLGPAGIFSVAVACGWISLSDLWRPGSTLAGSVVILWVIISLGVHFFVSVLGMLRFGSPLQQNATNIARLRLEGWDPQKRLVLCFVSQGIQEVVLKSSVEVAISLCRQLGVVYEVEIVVDTKVPQDPYFEANGCAIIVVPSSYETPNQSRFKARSLSYAAHNRKERLRSLGDSWVLHCDEDTILTISTIAGIHEHLQRVDSSKICGAGEIKYNVTLTRATDLFSFIECHRTGEDLGRFRLQFSEWGAALFGMHGSFLLVPAELECRVDFDFGPRGSIAEDIYFALRLRELGIACRWIEGYVREQSPSNSENFVRQRARWIHGLLNGCLDEAFSWKRRALLLGYLAMWRTTLVSGVVLTCLLLVKMNSPQFVSLWALSMLVIGTNSWVGAVRNAEEDVLVSGWRFIGRLSLSVLLIPVVCLFESVAVVLAIMLRPRDFFVVQKDVPLSDTESVIAYSHALARRG